jgi:hypothetical protein
MQAVNQRKDELKHAVDWIERNNPLQCQELKETSSPQ